MDKTTYRVAPGSAPVNGSLTYGSAGVTTITILLQQTFLKTYFSISRRTYTTLLSVSPFNNLSCMFKVNKPKYPDGLRIDSQEFMPDLHKICLSGPVGPTISEKSVIVSH